MREIGELLKVGSKVKAIFAILCSSESFKQTTT